jgi:hypothetical protein
VQTTHGSTVGTVKIPIATSFHENVDRIMRPAYVKGLLGKQLP